MLLDNRSRISDGLIQGIVRESGVPADKLLLAIGAPRMVFSDAGECISRRLWDAGVTFGNDTPLNEHEKDEWDVAVQISERVSEREGESPYFIYLLAHELGHGRIILGDLPLHAANSLIEQASEYVSGNGVRAHDNIIERRLDQFGLAVAERLVGKEALKGDIARLLADTTRKDHDRLWQMLDLEPRVDLQGLRADLEAFTAKQAVIVHEVASSAGGT